MKDEVHSAVDFLSKTLATRPSVTEEQRSAFRDTLQRLITAKFEHHWHPDQPLKGNAFRCLNIDTVTNTIDPILVKAAQGSDVSPLRLSEVFPDGLDLWIDPGEVSCRIGQGDIWPIFQRRQPFPTQRPQQRKPLVPTQVHRGFSECSNDVMKRNRYSRSRRYDEDFHKYHWVRRDLWQTTQVCWRIVVELREL